MDWADIYQDLADEMDSHADAAATLREKKIVDIRNLLLIEPSESQTIDSACRQYAKTGRWPALSQNQIILAYVRMGQAAKCAELFASHQSQVFPTEYLNQQKAIVLEFLLIDYWHFSGNLKWRND